MESGELELLIMQATPFCNIDCAYCYLPNRDDKTRMSLTTVARAAEFAATIGVGADGIEVAWHCGEPLVVPADWYAQAQAIVSDGLDADRVRFRFQSNGTLLTPEWVRFFREHPQARIALSLDGPRFLHDRRRRTRSGQGTYDRALRGAHLLRSGGIPFTCISVVTEDTLDHPDAFYAFFADLKVPHVALNIDALTGANANSSLLRKSVFADNENRFRQFIRRLAELSLRENGRVTFREFARMEILLDRARAFTKAEAHEGNQINVPWRTLSVDCSGEVHTFSPELLGIDLPQIGRSLGNVHSDTPASISSSARFAKLQSKIDAGVDRCRRTCGYFEYCGGGDPSYKWGETGSFDAAETMHCRLIVQAVFDEYLTVLGSAPKPPPRAATLEA